MDHRFTILIVDDTPDNISLLNGLLKGAYRVKIANNGLKALKAVGRSPPPDLILLDIMMPEMDGYEVCRRLKADPATADIPVIFLTAKTHVEDERRGLALGAVDYIIKPISPPILLSRVQTHLRLKEAKDHLADQNALLERKVAERTRWLVQLQDVTMVAMGALAESRDPETGNHIRRTRNYVRLLAEHLSDHPRFRDFLTPENIELLYKSAPLHDIGKVGVPDHILLKPGRLTAEEFELMKKHTIFGRDAIIAAEKMLEDTESFLVMAREIAWFHQEKWDGSGYPQGLAGDDIPISARLMAVADVYDALISRRVYKPPFSHEKSVAIIKAGSGSHFDPDMVTAFLEISDRFLEIAKKYEDGEAELPAAPPS